MRAGRRDLSYGLAAGSIAAAIVAGAVVIFAALGGDDIMAALERASGAIVIALALGLLLGAITHTFARRRERARHGDPPPRHVERQAHVPIERDVRTDLTGLVPRLHDMARRPRRSTP